MSISLKLVQMIYDFAKQEYPSRVYDKAHLT